MARSDSADSPQNVSLEPRAFPTTRYERVANSWIKPLDYKCAMLAAELADLFATTQPEIKGSTQGVLSGLRKFMRWMSALPQANTMRLRDVTDTDIYAWEAALKAHQQVTGSNGPYDDFVNFRVLLLRIAHDHPSRLDPSVHRFLASPIVTILIFFKPDRGLPPFSHDEHLQIVKAAYRDVSNGYKLLQAGDRETLDKVLSRTLVALHVLLAMGTGEPPEVLRGIQLHHIKPKTPNATKAPKDSFKHANWLDEIVQGAPLEYFVQTSKDRAHQLRTASISRRHPYSCFALEASVRITQPFREPDGSSALWIDRKGMYAKFDNGQDLRWWLKLHGVKVAGRASFARFRKRVVGDEVMRNAASAFASKTRHTPEMFFTNYTNDEDLQAHAGRERVEASNDAFERARGAAVITPGKALQHRNGQSLAGVELSSAQINAVLDGELDGEHAACIDPLNSPHEPKGAVCSMSATGMCFACQNAVITAVHLPAVVFIADYFRPSRVGDRAAWERTWGPMWLAVTEHILPQFDPVLVEQARTQHGDVYIDLGLVQDIGALDFTI